jgi:hypothetical protein
MFCLHVNNYKDSKGAKIWDYRLIWKNVTKLESVIVEIMYLNGPLNSVIIN